MWPSLQCESKCKFQVIFYITISNSKMSCKEFPILDRFVLPYNEKLYYAHFGEQIGVIKPVAQN